ncbi:MAG: 30S ribosomal protein S9 [Nanoarchaeota archaeon]|nr:30S ribosomal protein S9 [Nanoarchaeota archaeon]
MTISKPKPVAPAKDKSRYIEAVGRRKAAIARVRIYPSTNKPLKSLTEGEEGANSHLLPTEKLDVMINEKTIGEYFKIERLRQMVATPFGALNAVFKVTAMVQGGGPSSQAEAIRLGLSRALNNLNEKWRTPLKAAGFLKRDSRIVERKKPGLRKARRPQQWRKR